MRRDQLPHLFHILGLQPSPLHHQNFFLCCWHAPSYAPAELWSPAENLERRLIKLVTAATSGGAGWLPGRGSIDSVLPGVHSGSPPLPAATRRCPSLIAW